MKPVILAVDDDSIILDVYEVILGDLYCLHVASSGQEALHLLQTGPRFDLILLDIMMPGMTGHDVCQKIRNNPLYSHLKIILVSANSLINERLEGYAVGADDYITKPFEEHELLSKINVFLRFRNISEFDKMKYNLLLILSHEMRTPLNGILGFSQILQQSLNLDTEEKEYVEFIIQSGIDLLHLSEKALLLNDLNSGHMTLGKERLNLHHLVSECQHKVSNLAEQKQLSFQIQRDVDIEWDGDPKLLFHAFEAVLDNAVKFAHRGTVVDITFKRVGTHAQVCIANEGEPIHEDHLEDIFDAFFVPDLEHHHRGHGLSLAIARSIVEAHGGTLQVENRRTGPVFVFNL